MLDILKSPNALLSIANQFIPNGPLGKKMYPKTFKTPTLSLKLKSPSSYVEKRVQKHSDLHLDSKNSVWRRLRRTKGENEQKQDSENQICQNFWVF